MIKFIEKIKSETGQSMVIFAVAFVVLCGSAALAIDIGSVAIQKGSLQKGIDAAAIAGAMDLPSNPTTAVTTAKAYAVSNGISSTVTATTDGNKITVSTTKNVPLYFSRIFGNASKNITVRAVAKSGGTGAAAFNYAMFSGSSDSPISFSSCSAQITGSIHTNNVFKAANCSISISDTCEAVKGIDIPSWMSLSTKSNNPAAQYIAMPDFSDQIKAQATATGTVYNTSQTFTSKSFNLDKPIYVNGNLTIKNCSFSGSGWLFATGNITINSCSFSQTSGKSLCIYSQNGNVTFSNASLSIKGIVYAPKGTVDVSSVSVNCTGSIVANIIKIGNNSISVKYSSDVLGNLPTVGAPTLVE
jgi:Flp pilus assembly protein TadG